jgi:hypothetical protein
MPRALDAAIHEHALVERAAGVGALVVQRVDRVARADQDEGLGADLGLDERSVGDLADLERLPLGA